MFNFYCAKFHLNTTLCSHTPFLNAYWLSSEHREREREWNSIRSERAHTHTHTCESTSANQLTSRQRELLLWVADIHLSSYLSSHSVNVFALQSVTHHCRLISAHIDSPLKLWDCKSTRRWASLSLSLSLNIWCCNGALVFVWSRCGFYIHVICFAFMQCEVKCVLVVLWFFNVLKLC